MNEEMQTKKIEGEIFDEDVKLQREKFIDEMASRKTKEERVKYLIELNNQASIQANKLNIKQIKIKGGK